MTHLEMSTYVVLQGYPSKCEVKTMGIGFNQFDFINNRFTRHQIKALDVTCKEFVQAEGTTSVDVGTTGEYFGFVIVDPATGQFTRSIRMGSIDAAIAVDPDADKVIDTFVVPLQIVDEAGNPIGVPVIVNINQETECEGIENEDETVVQKHDIQPEIDIQVTGNATVGFTVHFTVVLDYCLVVATETILKVSAARKFC